jgi:hypothetical protein
VFLAIFPGLAKPKSVTLPYIYSTIIKHIVFKLERVRKKEPTSSLETLFQAITIKVEIVKVLFSGQSLAKCPKNTNFLGWARKLRAAPSSRSKSPSPSDHSPTGLTSSIDWHHLPENPTAPQGPQGAKNETEQEFLGPLQGILENISSFLRSFKEWFPSN